MAGTITLFYLCDKPPLIRASPATYRACPVRALRGQNDGSLARPAEIFFGGEGGGALVIGTCMGKHSGVS